MVFSSVPFLYVFLPVVLLCCFVVPKRFKNLVLLAASLFFYYYGERAYTSLLLISSLSDYLHSLYIEKHRGTQRAKIALVSSIAVNLALLGFFKYADFLISTVNGLLRTSIPLLTVPLPIGMSPQPGPGLKKVVIGHQYFAAVRADHPGRGSKVSAVFPAIEGLAGAQ